MNTSYFVFVGLYLLGILVRTIYEILKKAGRLDPKNKIIFAVVFAAMCTFLVSWFILCSLDPFRLVLPIIVRWLALTAVLTGFAIAMGGLVQLRGVENIDHLVTTGLFSKLRHPMYTGFILCILGWAIYQNAIVSLLIGSIAIASIISWRHLEEVHLESVYAEDYRVYRQKTWF